LPLHRNQSSRKEIAQKDLLSPGSSIIFVITTAALVHDIGHGPFSHSFELVLRRLFNGQDIVSHEVMGGRILDVMYEKYEAIQIEYSRKEIELIKALMEPELSKSRDLKSEYHEKGLSWIFSVVSGPLDVDKLDYLSRDSYSSGLGRGSYGLDRILSSVRVIDDQLAFEEKALQEIVDILRKR